MCTELCPTTNYISKVRNPLTSLKERIQRLEEKGIKDWIDDAHLVQAAPHHHIFDINFHFHNKTYRQLRGTSVMVGKVKPLQVV